MALVGGPQEYGQTSIKEGFSAEPTLVVGRALRSISVVGGQGRC